MNLRELIENLKKDTEHEDLGAEVIADFHYDTKYQAFLYGYNTAIDEVIKAVENSASRLDSVP